ncbi:MAG TPA: hypothetical protein PK156_23735 [Polyangium sp.]|nr:hypothetical protein [Polyangium sp.]
MKNWSTVFVVLAGMGFSSSAHAVQPIGYLDNAGCDVIAGWSQDQDIPDSAIDVHVYFNGPAGTPGAPAIGTRADVHRDDLCTAIGSCAHGYYVKSPYSLHDGMPHDVYAYGIDNAGEGNPVLGNSPRTLQCAPAAQTGVRRRIDDVPTLDAWHFSTFWDLLPLTATDADALPEGTDMPERPHLVQADDGTPEVYWDDHGVKRHITQADVAEWRFDLGQVQKVPAAEIQAMPTGTSLRTRPVLFIHGGLYVVDDPQPYVIPPVEMGSSSSSSSSGGDLPPVENPPEASCAYAQGSSATSDSFYMAIPWGLGLAFFRTRRKARASAK